VESNGDEISISFIENVFATLFSVEKKIFNKASNRKKLYKVFSLIKFKKNLIKYCNE